MPTETIEKRHLTVKPEFNDFVQEVDEYCAQLPLVTRESIRQALYSEYEEDYGKAAEICSEILAKDPDNVDALMILGRAQLSERNYEAAEQSFRELLEKEPDKNFARISHGICFHALGRYQEAIRELQKADPEEEEHHPFYYSTLGDCYENTGNRLKAREAYRAEIAWWERTGEPASPENVDGCFCNLIYLDAALYLPELPEDLDLYKRFLEKAEMTDALKDHLTSNIAYWSTLLTVPVFRGLFVDFVKNVEEAGYLADSPGYYIIDDAYRAEESYRYHEDKKVDAFMESFLSAEISSQSEDSKREDLATRLGHEWYMSRCADEYAENFLYVAEHYPYTYKQTVTFLDQLQTFGPEKIRERILDRLEEEKLVQAGTDRQVIADELDQVCQTLRNTKKQPVYLAEGAVTYKRNTKKIMPNDPCPCGSGKKYKKCHGRK